MKLIHLNIFIILIGLFLFGCTQKNADEYVAEAKVLLSDNKSHEATIALKNALVTDANNLDARLLLGEVYLNSGRFEGALKELERAYRANHLLNETVPLLSKAQFHSEQFHELVNLSVDDQQFSSSAKAQVLYYQVLAQFAQGKTATAQKSISYLLKKEFDNKYTPLASAFVQYHKNNFVLALEKVEKVLNEFPNFTEGLRVKATIASSLNRDEEVRDSLKRYVELVPYDLKNRLFYTSVLVSLNDTEEATVQANGLLNVAPEQGYLNQLKSVLEMRAGNFDKAKEYASKAIQNGSATIISRMVAGVSAYRLGKSEQAFDHLSVVVKDLPSGHPVWKLFGMLQIELGYAQDAIETLEGLNESDSLDVDLLIESSKVLLKKGELARAADVLKMVDTTEFMDADKLLQFGVLKLAVNDKTGIEDFEAVLAEEPKFDGAIQPLAIAYTKEGRIDEAIELANSLIELHPNSVDGYNLMGHILGKAKRDSEAVPYYEKALQIKENNINSFLHFGKRALFNKDYQEALKLYRKMATFRPAYLPAITTYYKLEKSFGDVDAALKAFESLYSDSNGHINTSLIYAKVLETERQYKNALTVLDNISVDRALPNAYWELYVDVLRSLNRLPAIESKLQDWVRTASNNELAWRTLATYYERQGDYERALSDVRRGIQKINTSDSSGTVANLRVLEAQYLLNLNKSQKAKSVIDQLNTDFKGHHVIELLEGQLEMIAGNYTVATSKLMINYEARPSTNTLILVLKSMLKDNKANQAIKLAKGHLEQFQSDLTARMYLANLLMSDMPEEAEKEYQLILQDEENNVIALNNLAYLLDKKGESDKALSLAEKAAKIAVESPAVLDTYANILNNNGQSQKAVKIWEKAYNLSDKQADIAQHYMQALIKNNHPEKAAQVKSEAGL